MTNTLDSEQHVTAVITHHIQDTQQALYEAWLQEIVPFAKSYPGHQGVLIIRPVAGGPSVYTIVIRFDSQAHLVSWMDSDDRKKLVAKAQPCLVQADHYQIQSGLDFWFTPEGAKPKIPMKWKQSLITWSAIFPLVASVSFLVGLLENWLGLPSYHYLNTLVITGIVVLLMVYVVMPRYTKLVHRWLYQ